MEQGNLLFPALCLLCLLFYLSNFILKRKSKYNRLPPSPPSLPIIGHFHLLKDPLLHRSLHELSRKYGDLLFLRFGTRKVLVVTSPSAVEECFTRNDIVFANRPRTLAAKHIGFNYKGIGFASYGDHWRNLRRLMTMEVLSTSRIAEFIDIREEEVILAVKGLFERCKGKTEDKSKLKIELRPVLVEIAFNAMLRVSSGKRYYGKDAVAQEAKQFQTIMREVVEIATATLNDFFPILQCVDFLGVERKMINAQKKADRFFQKLIEEHVRNRNRSTDSTTEAETPGKNKTVIDLMLSLRETDPEFYTDENIKGIVAAILVAGSDTSATAMEWALSLLLNHPEAMQKVKIEIEKNVGYDRLVSESDIPKLSYLQNVITETLRLYPSIPFLLPHENSSDCTVGGYDIPEGTMLLVNLWTMQRDPKVWKDPTKFMPERFEDGELSEGYKMIPFGSGRRSCPGAVLAKRAMAHALGALIQCFEWERIGPEEIDMDEGLGMTLPKAEPLLALCKPRQGMINLLSNL